MNKKNIISAALIILVVGVYYFFQAEPESNQPVFNVSKNPTYTGKDMLTTVYDPSGAMIYKISSSTVEHFDELAETIFGSPHVTIYDKNKNASWTILANQAKLTKPRILYLTGDVQFNNLAPLAQLERIKTESAKVDLATQVITSQDEITIQGPGFYSKGIGLKGDLKDRTANLLDNVKTFYNYSQSSLSSEAN